MTILIICIASNSCTLAPKKETARFNTDLSFEETKKVIKSMVETCWTKESGFMKDGVYGFESYSDKGYTMSIGRDNIDIPFMPFVNIIINENNNNTYISLEEGKKLLMKKDNVEKVIKNWLIGIPLCD